MNEYQEVLETRGDRRLVLALDMDTQEPYDDGGSPILWRDYTRGGWHAEQEEKISSYTVHPRIVEALQRWGPHDIGDHFGRYVRAFHGATVVDTYQDRDGRLYVTLDPREWREEVGAAEGSVSLEEWRAYCEGDVYGWIIQERVTWTKDGSDETREDWEDVDSCWGFYGRQYAEEAAREEFGE